MDVAESNSCLAIINYLRWVANEGSFAQNINDLKEEGTGKFVELTIYGKIEWSISCGDGDYLGHERGDDAARRAHYHFQMRFNKQAFIRFNDYHVPLHDSDIHLFEAIRALPDKMHLRFSGGPAMSELMSDELLEDLVMNSNTAPDAESAMFNLQTIISADPRHDH